MSMDTVIGAESVRMDGGNSRRPGIVPSALTTFRPSCVTVAVPRASPSA
jgi:hypothetical protein